MINYILLVFQTRPNKLESSDNAVSVVRIFRKFHLPDIFEDNIIDLNADLFLVIQLLKFGTVLPEH